MAEKRLREFIEFNPSVKLKKGVSYPCVEMDKISIGKKNVDTSNIKEYTGASSTKFLPNDTLMARITPCLENGKIGQFNADTPGFGSTEFFVLRAKPNLADPNYIYYLAMTYYVRQLAANSMTGASGRQRADRDFVSNIKWNLPDLNTQKKIADILSAYDDLIENNNKRIKILEQMAENLYKEWFVRFRFPGYEHKTTRDWQIKKASEIFNITIGRTPSRKVLEYFSENPISNYPWISISDIKDINTFIYKTKEYLTPEAVSKCRVKIIPKNTVILSFKLTVGKVAITTSDMCTNEAIAHFLINDNILKEYIYLYLKNFEYANLGNTSSIGTAINSEIVKNMKIILPTREILTQFHRSTYKYFENIRLLNELNINLIKQRDLLLPRLMSGKLKV